MSEKLLESRPEKDSPKPGLAGITERLAASGRILQHERGASLFLRAWPWVLGFVVAAFVADIILHLGGHARLALDIAFIGLVLGLAGVAAWLAWKRRPTFEHVARVLESRDAHLGSKLINILQLKSQTQDERLAPLTRDLAGMAIEGYAEELAPVDFRGIARTTRIQEDARRAAIGLMVFAAVLTIFVGISGTEFPRFLDPFGDHPPYSFTRIEIADPKDDGMEVTYGQSFLITAKTSGHHPRELFLSYHAPETPEHVTTVPMFDKGEKGFTQQIEGMKSDLIIVAHNKTRHSLSKKRRVNVALTPKLEGAFVKIAPPPYTGLKVDERPLPMKSLKALAGTELTFRLRSNRPLKEGRLELTRGPGDVETLPLAATAEFEVSGSLTAKDSGKMAFTFVDRDGHPSGETWECALQVTHDLGPDIQIRNPTADSFVAMDFIVEVVFEANDDYGVKTMRIHQARNGAYGEPQVVNYEAVTRNAREIVTLDLKTMNLTSGDKLTFFAEAIDTAPDAHLARSKTVTLTVITVEEYNAFLRERTDLDDIAAKYSDLLNQMHDLLDEQRALSEQAEALKAQLEQAPSEAAQKKFDQLVAQQNEINAKLNKLAEHMDSFVREQPLYDIEAELQETLQAKAKEIRESTKQNSEATQSAAQRSTNPQGERQLDQSMADELKKASDAQLAKLGGAEQEARKEMMEPLEDLALIQEIMKDLNRIKALDEAQRELAAQAKAYDRSTPLTREDQLALKDLAAQEKAISEGLKEVQEKLRVDAEAASEKFPKAAESADTIANAMGELRLQMLAENATNAMLQARGDKSAQLAQRLSDEMGKLFSECQGQGQGMSNEMDSYLSLSRGLNPGNNFQQMMQCRKFGSGNKPGTGMGMGPAGVGGESGFAVSAQPNANVLGNESRVSDSKSSRLGATGRSEMKADAPTPAATVEKADVLHGVNAIDRESDSVQSETTIEQYSDLVEKYFKAITK